MEKKIPLFTTRLLYAYFDEARRDPKAYLCLGFLTLLNAPFHKSFLFFMVVEDFITRDLVPGEGESLEYRLAKLGLHCHIFLDGK